MDACLTNVAKGVQFGLWAIWLLHGHIFFCIGGCVFSINKYVGELIELALGPLTTPGIAVLIMNEVCGVYGQIQSWQVAYILWGVGVSLLFTAFVVWKHRYDPDDETKSRNEHIEQFMRMTLLPFGVTAKECGNSFMFLVPLVSTAPALVGGYIANFILAPSYTLECDIAYNVISEICEDGVCCLTVSSHEDLITFAPKLASSILAGWGIVKYLALFLIKSSGEVVVDDGTKDAGTNDVPDSEPADIEAGDQTEIVYSKEDGKAKMSNSEPADIEAGGQTEIVCSKEDGKE